MPGLAASPVSLIDVFAVASARLDHEIARQDPEPFKHRLASVGPASGSATALMQASSAATGKAGLPTSGEQGMRLRLAQRAGIKTVARSASRLFRSPTFSKSPKSANG